MKPISVLASAAVENPEGLLALAKEVCARAQECDFDRGYLVEMLMQKMLRTGDFAEYALIYYLTALILDAMNAASTLREPERFQWESFLHELKRSVPAYK